MSTQQLQDIFIARINEHEASLGKREYPENRSSACIAILHAVEEFLCSWEELEIPSVELPCELLQRSMSRVVAELGPGNSKLRLRLSTMLQSKIKTTKCRQVILDFLPATIPLEYHAGLKDELIKTLQAVFEENYDALEQILVFLSRLVRSKRISKSDAFDFVLNMLKTVPERCLHLVFVSLVEYAGDYSDAIMLVEAFRQEMKLLEDAQATETDPHSLCVAEAIVRVSNSCSGSIFLQAYLNVIDDALCSETASSTLLIQDVIVLVLSLGDEAHYDCVERVFDGLLMRNALQRPMAHRLVKLCADKAPELLRKALLEQVACLTTLAILAPVRNRKFTKNDASTVTCWHLISNLAGELSGRAQRHLVSSLFCLADELEADSRTGSQTEIVNVHQTVLRSIFEIVASIGQRSTLVLKPFKARIIDRLTLPHESGLYDGRIIGTLCSIVAYLDNPDDPSTDLHPDSIMAVRSLLYSTPMQSTDNVDERSVRGMILAAAVISSHSLDQRYMVTLWSLTQAFMVTSACRSSSPALKLQCVKFLAALYEWSRNNTIDHSALKLKMGIFDMVTLMTSTPRIVKYVASFSEWGQKGSILQYTTRPAAFAGNNLKQQRRKMYFSFETILRNRHAIRPSSWDHSAQWMFQLTRTYLVIGRELASSKWLPNPWIEAAIEFPCLDMTNLQILSSRRRQGLVFFNNMAKDTSLSSNGSRADGSEKEFFESLKSIKDRAVLYEILRCLLRYATSLVFGLSMSAAVLNNSHDHFKKIAGSCDEGSVKLLQFQLFKIYDMVEKCRFTEKVFRSIGKAIRCLALGTRKRKRNMKPKDESIDLLQADVDDGSAQIQFRVSRILQTTDMIQPDILWTCLAEPAQDALIIKAAQSVLGDSEYFPKGGFGTLLETIDSRLNIIEHITSIASHAAEDICPSMGGTSTRRAKCLRLCAYLSLELSKSRNTLTFKNKSSDLLFQRLSVVTASSFQLLHVTMLLSVETMDASNSDKPIDEFYMLYLSILGTDDPLNHPIKFQGPPKSSAEDASNQITRAFLTHLNGCGDSAIAYQLVESWSVFALHYEQDPLTMVDITWSMLKSQNKASGPSKWFRAPYILLYTLNQYLPASLAPTTGNNVLERVVHDTVVKLVSSKSRNTDKTPFLAHGIIRHWALLILLMENGDSTMYDHLSHLFSNLSQFLLQVQASIPGSSAKYGNDDTSDEDGEYIPPEGRRETKSILPAFDVGGVDACTFPAVFDVLLQISIATLSILSIDRESSNPNLTLKSSPFRRFESFLCFFGSMVTLYRCHFSIFPTKTLTIVLRASSNMLRASQFQLQRCINWRNQQPAFPAQPKHGGDVDPASVKLLGTLLHSMQRHVVSALESLCDILDKSTDSSGRLLNRDPVAFAARGNRQRNKSLRLRTHKFKLDLLRAARVHNLPAPSFNADTKSTSDVASGGAWYEPFGALNFRLPLNNDKRREVNTEAKTAASAGFVLFHSNQEGSSEEVLRSISDEASMSLSSSSESFGALGDWGESSDENDVGKSIGETR